MTLMIDLSPETEAKLRARAQEQGKDLALYAAEVLTQTAQEGTIFAVADVNAHERSVNELLSRSPEQIAADRAGILASARRARSLPEGKTLEEVVVGHWPGMETDEEVDAALRELS